MADQASTERWVALPTRGRPRFVLPVTTRRIAHGALAVYQPVTMRSLVAWTLARQAARLGLLRLLPSAPAPTLPDTVHEVFAGAVVAIQSSSRPTRRSGLALDRTGRPIGAVKLATDGDGLAKLAQEVAWIREFGPFLGPPLVAPGILVAKTGVLCCGAAAWSPRPRAWELPPDVAAAIGALYRRGGGSDRQGPAHGDFAPWNLLRLRGDGWLLIDWEDATTEGTPFQDPFHWLVQAHAFLGRPGGRVLVASVENCRGSGWVVHALDAYASAAGLGHLDRMAAFRTYLSDSIDRLTRAGGKDRRGLTARESLRRLAGGAPSSKRADER
jgi:hypothetical protein